MLLEYIEITSIFTIIIANNINTVYKVKLLSYYSENGVNIRFYVESLKSLYLIVFVKMKLFLTN